MPTTEGKPARATRKFGNTIVDELVNWFNQMDATYRTGVRDLNEINFARFDAKLEQRVAELDARLGRRIGEVRSEIAELRTEIRTGLARLEGGLVARIGLAEGRLARLTGVFWVATLAALTALIKL